MIGFLSLFLKINCAALPFFVLCYFIQVLLSRVSWAIIDTGLMQANISRLGLCLVKLIRFRMPTSIDLASSAGRTTSYKYLKYLTQLSEALTSEYLSA